MSTDESRGPTFDGTDSAEQSGKVADVSGIKRDEASAGGEKVEQPEKANEAAQIVPLEPPPPDAPRAEEAAFAERLAQALTAALPPLPPEPPDGRKPWPWLTKLLY